jgi:tryptophanyl-tRNA synthetase
MGLLERCHSFKDKTSRGIAPSHGLFAYPVLMAADILIYDSDIVPVGRDQKQHLEVTRDIAIKMNETFGSIFKLPEPAIQESTAVVPGLDGAKMSKSYHNTIDLFAPENVLRKKIMGIKTDSTPVEEPKPMEGSVILALHKLVASEVDHLAMENDFRVGGAGYGDLKKRLFGAVWEYFAPFRAKRVELEADPGHVEKILAAGAEKAAVVADGVMRRVRNAVGIGPGIDNAATRP